MPAGDDIDVEPRVVALLSHSTEAVARETGGPGNLFVSGFLTSPPWRQCTEEPLEDPSVLLREVCVNS